MKKNEAVVFNQKWGVVLSFILLLVTTICNLFFTKKILIFVGDYQYGLYSFVLSIIECFSLISSALNASFIRFSTIAENNEKDTGKTNSIYLTILSILSIFVILIVFSITIPLYFNDICFLKYNLEDSKTIYLLFAFSSINMAISMSMSIYNLFISYKKKFIFQKLLSLIITVFSFLLQFLVAFLTNSVVAISISVIITTIINSLIQAIFCYKCLSFKTSGVSRDDKQIIKTIIAFSSILLLNSVVDLINNQVDKTFLGIFSTPENVTLYKLGQTFPSYLLTASIAVSSVFVPTINEYVVSKNDDAINDVFSKVSHIQIIIVFLITFGFVSCGKEFVTLWLSEEYYYVYIIGVALMITSICPLTMNISIEIQRARNMHKFRAISYFICAILNIILTIIFILTFKKEYSIFGCLLGTVIASIVGQWVLMNIYNSKIMKLPVKQYLLKLLIYFIACLIISISILLFDKYILNSLLTIYRFLICGSLFVFLYIAFVAIIDHKFLRILLVKKVK